MLPNPCLGIPSWVRLLVANSLLETTDAKYDDALDVDHGPSGLSVRLIHP